MRWFELLENPYAITESFIDPPELHDLPVREVTLSDSGGFVRLWLELPRLPDKKFKQWDATDAPMLLLAFFNVDDLQITGWAKVNRGTVLINRDHGKLAFVFNGKTCWISGKCEFAMIEDFRPVRRTDK